MPKLSSNFTISSQQIDHHRIEKIFYFDFSDTVITCSKDGHMIIWKFEIERLVAVNYLIPSLCIAVGSLIYATLIKDFLYFEKVWLFLEKIFE